MPVALRIILSLHVENKFVEPFQLYFTLRNRRGCDRMVVGFITTYAISTYHH